MFAAIQSACNEDPALVQLESLASIGERLADNW
jgi:hypothetical protein